MQMMVEFWRTHSESIIGTGYKALLCTAILLASGVVARGVRRLIRKAKDRFEKIASNESRFLREPAPEAMVVSMAGSSVNLQLRGWTTIDDYWQTCGDLNKQVKEEIEKTGLAIPLPQRSVHVVAGPGTIDAAEAGA